MTKVRNLFFIRKEQGITQTELAERIRKIIPNAASRGMISEFENCKHDTSQRTLEAMAQVLGVSIDALLEVREIKGKPRGYAARGTELAGVS